MALTTFATIFILFVGTTNLIVPKAPNFLLVPLSWIVPISAQEIVGFVIALRVTTMVLCWKLAFLRAVADVITH